MKAFFVHDNWNLGGYSVLVHAETKGKAKYKAQQVDPGDAIRDSDWIELGARREPKLDGIPFTFENCHEAGVWLESDYIEIDCDCEICREADKL